MVPFGDKNKKLRGSSMKFSTVTFSKRLTRHKVILEIEETHCLLVKVLYFLGIRVKAIKTKYHTLLEAEIEYDRLCETYKKGGYDSIYK